MMTKSLIPNINLVASAWTIGVTLVWALPCWSQTAMYTKFKSPKIVRPVLVRSSTNFNSPIGQPQSRHTCFQIDANSKMYVRNKNGGINYYPANSAASHTKTITSHPRCN